MEKRNDGLSFIVCCNKFGWTRSWGISRERFQFVLGALGIFVLGVLLSFFLSYKLYGEAQDIRAQKQAEIDELLSAVEAMSHDIIVDKKLEDKFIKRVLRLEKKLASIERRLSTKKKRRTPQIGGRGFRISDIGDDYFDAVERDIKRLDKVLAVIPFGRPASGSISSHYGYRQSPFSEAREFHGGVDFRGKTGDEVVTTADGVVEKAKYVKGYGKHVIIKHKKGYKTLYGHLSKIEVAKGQKVEAGEKIGELGSTGRSTGPHLHYEIIKYGKRINPKKYVR
ncbi:MAG: peptidoglycan DD-metalloendopeptidase family protein [Candidatus Dadabacteria bacterium]|nr:peptidoglycan DD-metalloendopeptidase family protein [Candidatus Dadabacteria bacterium]